MLHQVGVSFDLKYKIVVFDKVCILYHFNISLKHNSISCAKTVCLALLFLIEMRAPKRL